MGNWRNRLPRRIHRQRDHWASSSYHSDPPSELLQDNVPEWEKKFCYMVGSVPWRKLLCTKNFMSCHTSVLNWDDSAVEEMFQNAKKRFWSEMNGLDCEIPLPDPDIYIDRIDWNPDIDRELMNELDREFFNPDDDEEQNGRSSRKTKKARNWDSEISDGSNTNQADDVNRWEGNNNVNGVSESNENGWGEWKDCSKVNIGDNQWEVKAKNDGWERRENDPSNCGEDENPWERKNPRLTSRKDDGWGCSGSDDWNNRWVTSSQLHDRAAIDGGWRGRGDENRCGGRQWLPYNNESKRVDFRESGEHNNYRRSPYGFSGHRNGRFQGDDSRWATRVNDRKRVSFE